jgi:hypothetical protein
MLCKRGPKYSWKRFKQEGDLDDFALDTIIVDVLFALISRAN